MNIIYGVVLLIIALLLGWILNLVFSVEDLFLRIIESLGAERGVYDASVYALALIFMLLFFGLFFVAIKLANAIRERQEGW